MHCTETAQPFHDVVRSREEILLVRAVVGVYPFELFPRKRSALQRVGIEAVSLEQPFLIDSSAREPGSQSKRLARTRGGTRFRSLAAHLAPRFCSPCLLSWAHARIAFARSRLTSYHRDGSATRRAPVPWRFLVHTDPAPPLRRLVGSPLSP